MPGHTGPWALYRAWAVVREEDTERTVVVARTLAEAEAAWRAHVVAFYDMDDDEAEREQAVSIELLCDQGEVVVVAPTRGGA